MRHRPSSTSVESESSNTTSLFCRALFVQIAMSSKGFCFGWGKLTGTTISIKTFIESLHVVLLYLDQQSCKLEGVETIRATFAQIVALEIRNAASSPEKYEVECRPQDDTGSLREAMKVIQAKSEHIEQLEELIHELQTTLREEINKSSLQFPSTSTPDTTEGMEEIHTHDDRNEIVLDDEVENGTFPPSETLRHRLATLFRINGIVSKHPSKIAASIAHSTDDRRPDQTISCGSEVVPAEAAPDTEGKKRQKKLIHYSIEGSENTSVGRPCGLNDFDEYCY